MYSFAKCHCVLMCCRRHVNRVSGKYSPPGEAGMSKADGWMSAKFVHKNPSADEFVMREERSVDGPSGATTSFTAVNEGAGEVADTEMGERDRLDGDSTKKEPSTDDSGAGDLDKLQSGDGIQI